MIDQLQGAGQGGHPDAPVRQLPQNFLSVQLVHGGDGKNGLVNIHGPHLRQGLADQAADRHTTDVLVNLGGVIIKKALDVVAAVGIVLQFIQQLHPGGASADDGHRHRSRLLPLDAEGPVHPVAEPDGQHFQHPQAGDGRQQDEGNGLVEQGPAEDLIGAEAADGRAQQRQVFPALGVAPQAVVGLTQKLGDNGAPIQQQHIFREAALGAHLSIGQQHRDELVACHCHREQKRVAEKQQLSPKLAHDIPPKAVRHFQSRVSSFPVERTRCRTAKKCNLS